MNTATQTLEPINAKSFYNSAKLLEDGNKVYLRSYTTIVAQYNKETKQMIVSGWYSQTTARHINAFLRLFGFSTCNKSELENYQ